MKPLFSIGLIVLVLGVASLFFTFPRKERSGINVGGASVGVTTTVSEKVPVAVSALMIAVGAGMMIAGKTRG